MNLAKLPDRPLRIAFFGTPEIAEIVLAGLLEAKTDPVVLVICQPDRPRGRGKKVEAPPTKRLAEAHGIPVLQPTKMRDGAVAELLREQAIDLAVVTAFGRILPQDILDAPRFGAWNVHASLLPRHRGASPINFAILEGDRETGVTLMQMTAGLDEGPMLLESAIPIAEDDTTESLTLKLAQVGRRALLEGIAEAKRSGLSLRPQDESKATFAPLIKKEDGRLDFSEPAVVLARRVRAFHPWPGTFVALPDGQPLKVLAARAVPSPALRAAPGTLVGTDRSLDVATTDGLLSILEVQPPGRKPQRSFEFLGGAGRSLKVGDHLGSGPSAAIEN